MNNPKNKRDNPNYITLNLIIDEFKDMKIVITDDKQEIVYENGNDNNANNRNKSANNRKPYLHQQ